MAILKLTPSTYYLSNTSYLHVTNENNMYTDTDSETYATVSNTQTGTTSYYIYLRGFNFEDIPTTAVINSFSIKLKARETGISTSSSYAPKLCNGTSRLTSTFSAVTTAANVLTATNYSVDLDDLKSYGDDFGIRINCRRSNRNTQGYMYIYGAEIEIEYTVPNPAVITSVLNGDGTINPSGVYNTYIDEEYTLQITPADSTDPVTVVHDGIDVTNNLQIHYHTSSTETVNTVLGAYSFVSGSFNSYSDTEEYFEELVGNGVNAYTTTSNYYSGGSNVIAVFTYDMGITIPSNAQITRVWCEVNGHAESTSNNSEYMCVRLISGTTELSEEINFKNVSTNNTTVTLETTKIPTVEQISNMKLQCRLGYYGGAINGATVYVEYGIPTEDIEYYTYTFIVTDDSNVTVTIGQDSNFFIKLDGVWVPIKYIYRKTNGSWVKIDEFLPNSKTLYHHIVAQIK